jgi:hypothetical protein
MQVSEKAKTSEQITQEEHEKLLTFLRHHELSAGAEVNGQ